MKPSKLFIPFIAMLILESCKKTELPSQESVIQFEGFPKSANEELSDNQQIPGSHFPKVSELTFRQAFPKNPNQTDNTYSINYYRDKQFIASYTPYI
jgi:hypothetical protein